MRNQNNKQLVGKTNHNLGLGNVSLLIARVKRGLIISGLLALSPSGNATGNPFKEYKTARTGDDVAWYCANTIGEATKLHLAVNQHPAIFESEFYASKYMALAMGVGSGVMMGAGDYKGKKSKKFPEKPEIVLRNEVQKPLTQAAYEQANQERYDHQKSALREQASPRGDGKFRAISLDSDFFNRNPAAYTDLGRLESFRGISTSLLHDDYRSMIEKDIKFEKSRLAQIEAEIASGNSKDSKDAAFQKERFEGNIKRLEAYLKNPKMIGFENPIGVADERSPSKYYDFSKKVPGKVLATLDAEFTRLSDQYRLDAEMLKDRVRNNLRGNKKLRTYIASVHGIPELHTISDTPQDKVAKKIAQEMFGGAKQGGYQKKLKRSNRMKGLGTGLLVGGLVGAGGEYVKNAMVAKACGIDLENMEVTQFFNVTSADQTCQYRWDRRQGPIGLKKLAEMDFGERVELCKKSPGIASNTLALLEEQHQRLKDMPKPTYKDLQCNEGRLANVEVFDQKNLFRCTINQPLPGGRVNFHTMDVVGWHQNRPRSFSGKPTPNGWEGAYQTSKQAYMGAALNRTLIQGGNLKDLSNRYGLSSRLLNDQEFTPNKSGNMREIHMVADCVDYYESYNMLCALKHYGTSGASVANRSSGRQIR
jgi:hypothetical protein